MTKEMPGGCCVCSSKQTRAKNPLVYCDGQGCTVAVHKACYGITSIPSGAWLCNKCESQETDGTIICKLCPRKDGALKRTDRGQEWAHLVCALYIPEVEFDNVSTMEPIILKSVPLERFQKSCWICKNQGKEFNAQIGACMSCNQFGCENHFHVTCGQAEGLLCVKRGYSSPDTFFGYCPLHRLQLKMGSKTLKSIPAFKPTPITAGANNPVVEKSSSVRVRSSGSTGSSHGSKGKRRKKDALKSTTFSADNIPDSASLSVLVNDNVAQDNSSEALLNQEEDKNFHLIKSNGSKKKDETLSLVLRWPTLASQLSAPPITPSAPNQGFFILASPTSLYCSDESTLSNITDYGFPLSSEPIQNDQNTAEWINSSESAAHNGAVFLNPTSIGDGTEQGKGSPLLAIEAAASTSSGSSGPSHLEYSSTLSKINSEKKLDSKPLPAPNTKKKRRQKAPTIPLGSSTSRNSSKRRKIKTKTTFSSSTSNGFSHLYVPSIAVEGLLLPPFHHPVIHYEVIKPETEQAPLEASMENLTLTMSDQFHHLAENPSSSSVNKNLMSVAPQMLGNQLNPAYSVAQDMSDLLSAELDMRYASNALASSMTMTSSSSFMGDVSPTVNSTMTASPSAPAPHDLTNLLERQWEQGNHSFMEEGRRYDIASLLSCLQTIQQENTQLEDNVANLTQRRHQLLTSNARWSVPLTVQTVTEAPLMTSSGNRPDRTSKITADSFTDYSMEVSLQDTRSGITPYLPQMDIGINMPEHFSSYMGERGNMMYYAAHPTDGLVNMLPVQGSGSFSSMMDSGNMSDFISPSSTPEMAQSTASREQQLLPGLNRHSFDPIPMLSPTVPAVYIA